jgi:hypothetical protein
LATRLPLEGLFDDQTGRLLPVVTTVDGAVAAIAAGAG